MTISSTIISFNPGLDITAQDMNTNFSSLNNSTEFVATLTGASDTAIFATSATNIHSFTNNIGGLSVNSSGIITVNIMNGFYDYYGNKFQADAHFNGTGSGTYNHNWAGSNSPNLVMIGPINASSVSWAVNSIGLTTVAVVLSLAVSFNGTASYLY